MARVLLYLFVLLLLAAVGGVVYAMFAELPPPVTEVEIDLPGAAIE